MTDQVFISYRRRDAAREANLLKSLLESRLTDVAVYVDTRDGKPGEVFPERIREEMERSNAVIALIGPEWRGAAVDGTERIHDADDWVRQELEIALDAGAKILPILIDDCHGALDELPASIDGLAAIQRTPLTTDRWESDVQRIIDALLELISPGPVGDWPEPNELKKLFPALAPDEAKTLLQSGGVAGWTMRQVMIAGADPEASELYKVFRFSNFRRAFRFMERVAARADQFNHHPDWKNQFNLVEVHQRTWDTRHRLTTLDFQMAAYMNQASAEVEADERAGLPLE